MVVIMKPDASPEDIQYVVRRSHSLGLKTHLSRQDARTFIGLVGDLRGLDPGVLAGLRGVERVQALTKPFRLASLEFRSAPTIVRIRDVEIGGAAVVTMAGPCSVETEAQILETARGVRDAGARLFRGGAFKPRSSPYSFQGLAEAGLELLARARDETGLPIVT